MISLETASGRFEQTFLTEQNLPFAGTIQPLEDVKVYPDDYSHTRTFLRVSPQYTVNAGMVIRTLHNERFIMGDWDHGYENETLIYRSYVLYPVNKLVAWQRPNHQIDILTGEKKGTSAPTLLGNIHVLIETLVREQNVANVLEETKRVVTGSPVELGDIIDGMKIRKLNSTHGIRVLEVV